MQLMEKDSKKEIDYLANLKLSSLGHYFILSTSQNRHSSSFAKKDIRIICYYYFIIFFYRNNSKPSFINTHQIPY